MELEKNGVGEKLFLGVSGHPYFSNSKSTEFNVEQKNTCSFAFYISSSISTSRDMYLPKIVRKCFFYNLYKIHHVNVYRVYKKQQLWKSLFHFSSLHFASLFSFFFLLDGNALVKKKLQYFFRLEIFVDKTTFDFYSFNKVMIMLILNIPLQYSTHFI